VNLNKIKSSLIVLFLPGIVFCASAQNNGKINGIVKDATTLESIPFASVVLLDKHTNAVIKGVQTDTIGHFSMDRLPDGLFKCKISYVGYLPIVKDSVLISSSGRTVNFGDILIKPGKGSLLSEVTITGSFDHTQIGLDKKKFLVEQSLVSKAGSASELLQNIPTVSVDATGNVSLRGSSSINILIDGKPSLIAGGNTTQALQSLPASSIESIEVITNPSAKYDAEGASGIINIVLKKNKKLGLIGAVEATAGTRANYSGNASLSFQNSKVNVYGNYSYRNITTRSSGHQNIAYLRPADSVAFSNETFPSKTINKGHNIKLGIDYYLTDKSVFSLSGGYNSLKTDRNELLNIDLLNASNLPLQLSRHHNLTKGTGNNYDLNLDFTKTFRKPGEELVLSAGYAYGINDNFQSFLSDVYAVNGQIVQKNPAILDNENNNRNHYYNLKADFTLPIGQTGKVEAGYRSQIRLDYRDQLSYNFSDTTGYTPNYPFTSTYNSKNQIHALYFNYSNQIKNFNYQIGLRGEAASQTATVNGYDPGNMKYSTPIKVTNNRIYPGITLGEKFSSEQYLQFSYSRRVTRPTMRNLNPLVDISDPVNYDTGNPNLLPEDIHLFELGYTKHWKAVTLTSGLYHRRTNDLIRHVETDPVNGVITTISQNIPHAYTTGLEFIGRFNLVKGWDFTANANIYQNKTEAAPQYGIDQSSGLSWNTNITNNISVGRSLSVQVRADYHAPDKTAPDSNHAIYGIDAGAKLNILHNNASLTLNGRDIFNTRKWGFLRESNAVLLDFERRTTSARASFTFTYRFGASIFKSKKIEHSSELNEG